MPQFLHVPGHKGRIVHHRDQRLHVFSYARAVILCVEQAGTEDLKIKSARDLEPVGMTRKELFRILLCFFCLWNESESQTAAAVVDMAAGHVGIVMWVLLVFPDHAQRPLY